jgi:tetratricopeptide (TPR) repeat protein
MLKKAGRLEAHLVDLEARLAKDRKNPALLRLIASIQANQGHHARAAEHWARIVQLDPSVSSHSALVRSLGYARQYGRQVDAYEAFLAKFPDERGRHLRGLMLAYQNNGQLERAVEVGEEYAAKDVRDGHHYRSVASVCTRAKLYDKAIAFYRKAIKVTESQSNRDRWTLELAGVLDKQGDHDEALKHLKDLAASAGDRYTRERAERLFFDIMSTTDRLESYLKELTERSEKTPGDVDVLKQIARIHVRKRSYGIVCDLWRKICSIAPEPDHYLKLVEYQGHAQRYRRQVATYEAFFEKHPDRRPKHLRSLMTACKLANQLTTLKTVAKEYVEGAKKNGHAHREAARILRSAKCFKEAAAYQAKAIDLSTKESTADSWRLELAEIHHAAGDDAKAHKLLKALRESADDGRLRRRVDELLRVINRTKERNDYILGLKKKADDTPADADAQRELAEAYRTTGQFELAADYYRKALAAREDPETYTDLAYACRAAGHREEALGAYKLFMERATDPMQRDYTAKAIVELHLALDQDAEALEVIESVESEIQTPFVKHWMEQQKDALGKH